MLILPRRTGDEGGRTCHLTHPNLGPTWLCYQSHSNEFAGAGWSRRTEWQQWSLSESPRGSWGHCKGRMEKAWCRGSGRTSLLLSTAWLALGARSTQVSPPPALHGTGLVCVLGERGVTSVEKSSAFGNKARLHTTNTYKVVSSPADTHVPIAILWSPLGACILWFSRTQPWFRRTQRGEQEPLKVGPIAVWPHLSEASLLKPGWKKKITMKRQSLRPNTVTLWRSREGQEKNGYWKATWRAGLCLGLHPPSPSAISHLGGREAGWWEGTERRLHFPITPNAAYQRDFWLLGGRAIGSSEWGRYNMAKSCFNKAQGWVWASLSINQRATPQLSLKISKTAHCGAGAALKSNRQLFEQKYSRDWRTEVAARWKIS